MIAAYSSQLASAGVIPGSDLGSTVSISTSASWNQSNTNAVDSFTLISALDSGFTSGVSTLGTFTATMGLNAQTFAVSGLGRYVRLQVNSNYCGANINLGEFAFNNSAAPIATNVPTLDLRVLAGLALLIALMGVLTIRRKNR